MNPRVFIDVDGEDLFTAAPRLLQFNQARQDKQLVSECQNAASRSQMTNMENSQMISTADTHEVSVLTTSILRELQLESAKLGDEYFYQSLPLCVIDTVFSINNRYNTVQNVIARYCKHQQLRQRRLDTALPPANHQQSLTDFCSLNEKIGIEGMTAEVYENRQRTSPRNGILKSDATYQFAKCLFDQGVNYFQDLSKILDNAPFDRSILRISGQKSGLSLTYFWMLAGDESLIKPDRMILKYIGRVLNRAVTRTEAINLLQLVSLNLHSTYPFLTPRLLDHEIWKFQKDSKELHQLS